MVGLGNFDVENAPVRSNLLPAGDYRVIITSAEKKDNKAKNGWYLELKLEIIDGDHKKRVLTDRLNLENSNPLAMQIARTSLGEIGKALGLKEIKDSGQLVGKPLMMSVKIKVDPKVSEGEMGNKQNQITKYFSAKKVGEAAPKPSAESTDWMNG